MKLLGDAVQAGLWTKRVRKLIAFVSGKERVAHSPANFRAKSTGAWCGSVWLSLCLSLNAFAADVTPPTISSFTVGQAVPADFPITVSFSATIYRGVVFNSGVLFTNALGIKWQLHSNWSYTVWYASAIKGPWTEFSTPINLHPARVSGDETLLFLPVYKTGNRFYQLRATPSIGITYPP